MGYVIVAQHFGLLGFPEGRYGKLGLCGSSLVPEAMSGTTLESWMGLV